LALARGFREQIGASFVLLIGSSLIAAPAMWTLIQVITSPGAGAGDGQGGMFLVLSPMLQWFAAGAVGVVALLTALATERHKRSRTS
jgi:hypothetical protein